MIFALMFGICAALCTDGIREKWDAMKSRKRLYVATLLIMLELFVWLTVRNELGFGLQVCSFRWARDWHSDKSWYDNHFKDTGVNDEKKGVIRTHLGMERLHNVDTRMYREAREHVAPTEVDAKDGTVRELENQGYVSFWDQPRGRWQIDKFVKDKTEDRRSTPQKCYLVRIPILFLPHHSGGLKFIYVVRESVGVACLGVWGVMWGVGGG